MRKFWSYSLIVCFLVLAVPKSVYHDHSCTEENDGYPSAVADDCFVCDFDYAALSAPTASILSVAIPITKTGYYSYFSNEFDLNVIYHRLRGPPSFS